MAKTTADLAALVAVILEAPDILRDLPEALHISWANMALGFVDPTDGNYS